MKNKTTWAILAIFLALGKNYSQTTFTGKPMYEIVAKRAGVAIGTIKIELFPNIAPHHVRNFDSLVTEHFFDTTAFHRVIPGFMIQGGDPNTRHGTNLNLWGVGQAGQPTVDAEFNAAKHIRGRLSAARSNNINSATSQFFICVATAAHLDWNYSLYGQVTDGMTVVDDIVNSPCMTAANYSNMPVQKVEMFITRTGSNNALPNAPALQAPANGAVGVDSTTIQLKWNAVSDAIIYHLEIARDSLFEDTVMTKDVAANFLYASVFVGNTDYFWRVNTNNGGHSSAYTPVWKFHTKGKTTGLRSNNGDESLRVFPNPSNAKFTFSNIEQGSKIEIFDITGKLVHETIASDNEVLIDLSRKDKGEYFYKISNGKKEFQKGTLILQ